MTKPGVNTHVRPNLEVCYEILNLSRLAAVRSKGSNTHAGGDVRQIGCNMDLLCLYIWWLMIFIFGYVFIFINKYLNKLSDMWSGSFKLRNFLPCMLSDKSNFRIPGGLYTTSPCTQHSPLNIWHTNGPSQLKIIVVSRLNSGRSRQLWVRQKRQSSRCCLVSDQIILPRSPEILSIPLCLIFRQVWLPSSLENHRKKIKVVV